jgi:hypothetical protein
MIILKKLASVSCLVVVIVWGSTVSAYAQAPAAEYRPQWLDHEIALRASRTMFLTPRFSEEPAAAPQASSAGRQRSAGKKVLGAIVGATGGFFAGGFLGAKIDGECDCDDPGFKGALIGAPVGSVAGGILGYKFLF